MRTVILLGFLGVTFAAPLIPQPLLSASNSKELLMGLNNARLRNFQTRTQTSGLSQTSRSSLGHFGGPVPNQIPFPGQVKLAQRTQAVQQEPSQLQTLQQNQQDPYQGLPGGQQQMNADQLRGDVPETPGMPIENVLPYPQRDNANLGYPYGGIFIPSQASKPPKANILTSSTDTDNTIPSELVEEKHEREHVAEQHRAFSETVNEISYVSRL
ncbi:odontogenic ameloblast-associated protein [Trichosurus vulpecula]|uniref:odontogenic ameloblast-associated protein n=1 Tax=Trichosurus vulpecula TaxID=9337 RepID=UPI00186AD96C|nr:odontogenic ameloblast-associated protein [Trichosurus vulpecula]